MGLLQAQITNQKTGKEEQRWVRIASRMEKKMMVKVTQNLIRTEAIKECEIRRFGERRMWLRVEIWRKKIVVSVGGSGSRSRDGRWEVHLRT